MGGGGLEAWNEVVRVCLAMPLREHCDGEFRMVRTVEHAYGGDGDGVEEGEC